LEKFYQFRNTSHPFYVIIFHVLNTQWDVWELKKQTQNLENLIAASRKKLQDLWNERGYTDADVLQASIELDHLLNRYQKQTTQSSRPLHK